MAAVALRVTDAAKAYINGGHQTPVFSEVDLDVEAGEILVTTVERGLPRDAHPPQGAMRLPAHGLLPLAPPGARLPFRERSRRGLRRREARAGGLLDEGLHDRLEERGLHLPFPDFITRASAGIGGESRNF